MKIIDIKKEINNLKTFDYEPIYQLRINSAYSFTVFINGIPVANKYVNYLNNYLSEINSCIPEKGEQIIEIHIFPKYVDAAQQRENLGDDIHFDLKIEETSWENGSLKEPKSIYKFSLPEGDYSTQQKFVYKAKFNANVPYKLVDWRKGKTLEEKDSTILKQEILKVYESLKKDFENQKGESYVNSLGSGLFNLYQSSYFEKEEALDHINHRISFINEKPRKLAEIENYKLQISEDGKLISLNRTDGFNKEEGVLRRYYKKGIQEQVQVDDMILYAPKENDFQVIWHRSLTKGAKP